MAKKLSILMIVLAFGMLFSAKAAPVDGQKARLVATNFLKTQGAYGINLVDITSSTPFREFYVFVNPDGKGFVLVSGDDCVVPILGYSTDNAFVCEDMPVHVLDWLKDYESQIRFYRDAPEDANNDTLQDDSVEQQWKDLILNSASAVFIN